MAEELRGPITKRKKFIWLILILLFLLIIAAIIYLLLVYFQVAEPGTANLNANLNQSPVGVVEQPVRPDDFNQANSNVLADLKAINGEEPEINAEEEVDVLLVAEAFAERFGSYSNQSDYQNLDDLEIFMTESMNTWVESYKEDLKKQNPDINIYYAVETKAISNQVRVLDEEKGEAELLIKTQRQEFENDITNPAIFYQDILLKLVKADGQWKVQGAYWQ